MISVLYTVEQLVSLGAHIGNTRIYWDNSMYLYTLGLRKDIVILNMKITVGILKSMGLLIVDLARLRGRLIFFFSLAYALFGRALFFWLNVDYFSGVYLGGFISNLRKVWSVLDVIVSHGREFYTSITSLSFAPDFCVPTDSIFGLIGAESTGVGSLSAGLVDSDLPYGKFLYALPMNDNSVVLRFFLLRIVLLACLKGRAQERSLLLLNLRATSKFFKNCMYAVRTISLLSFFREMQQASSLYFYMFTYYFLNFFFFNFLIFLVHVCTVFMFVRYLNILNKLLFCLQQNNLFFIKVVSKTLLPVFKIDKVILLFFFTKLKQNYLLLFFMQKLNQQNVLVLMFFYLVMHWFLFFKLFICFQLKKIVVLSDVYLNKYEFIFFFKNIFEYFKQVYIGNIILIFEYLRNFLLANSFFIFNYVLIEDFLFFFFEAMLTSLQDEVNYFILQEFSSFSSFHFMKQKTKSFIELRQGVISQIVK